MKTKQGELLMANTYPAGDCGKKKMITMGAEVSLEFYGYGNKESHGYTPGKLDISI